MFMFSWPLGVVRNTNCPLSEEEHLLARRSDFDMGLLVSFNHDHDISQSYRSMNLNAYQTLKCCAAMHQIMRQLSTTVACMYLFVLQDDDALRCGNGWAGFSVVGQTWVCLFFAGVPCGQRSHWHERGGCVYFMYCFCPSGHDLKSAAHIGGGAKHRVNACSTHLMRNTDRGRGSAAAGIWQCGSEYNKKLLFFWRADAHHWWEKRTVVYPHKVTHGICRRCILLLTIKVADQKEKRSYESFFKGHFGRQWQVMWWAGHQIKISS